MLKLLYLLQVSCVCIAVVDAFICRLSISISKWHSDCFSYSLC